MCCRIGISAGHHRDRRDGRRAAERSELGPVRMQAEFHASRQRRAGAALYCFGLMLSQVCLA
jgi:hypothetical protein